MTRLALALLAGAMTGPALAGAAAPQFCRPIAAEHGCVLGPAYSPGLGYRPADIAELVQRPEAFVGLTVLVRGNFRFLGDVDGKSIGYIEHRTEYGTIESIAVDASALPREDREAVQKCYVPFESSPDPPQASCGETIVLGVVVIDKSGDDLVMIVASKLSLP
jgi:hypothetical protein